MILHVEFFGQQMPYNAIQPANAKSRTSVTKCQSVCDASVLVYRADVQIGQTKEITTSVICVISALNHVFYPSLRALPILGHDFSFVLPCIHLPICSSQEPFACR